MKLNAILFATTALAARPFLEEPDTGLDLVFGDTKFGSLPDLESIAGLPDFQWAARNYLPQRNFTYYRNAAGGEWSYRNNMEVFSRYTLKPRFMRDITKVNETMKTSILGHNFSAPFFMSPTARAGFGHPDAELNFVRAAAEQDVLYIPSLEATLSIENISDAKASEQVTFQQLYLPSDGKLSKELLKRIEASGAKAIVLTIDAPSNGNRQRAYRDRGRIPEPEYRYLTWDTYDEIANQTDLPIVLKGIASLADAREAVKHGVPAILLSNHGGRQLDTSPSSLEVALEIHQEAPEIFDQLEVYADGGVRYGTDVIKLLALGVRAVGLGRPFAYANVYGLEGVKKAIEIMKREVAVDAASIGVEDLQNVDSNLVNWKPNNWGQ
ncbi:cytochrome b2 [Sarocladium strictum]